MAEDASTIDPAEVARFERVAETWWDSRGPMRALHKFNPVRLAYIRDEACRRFDRDPKGVRPLEGLSILDVGCGGGLLCEPLARLGAVVTGLDPAAANIAVAKRHAAHSGIPVGYRSETVESVVARGERFDVVLAMEVVEHVTDVPAFVRACGAAVKPGGILVMATLNRTLRAFALAIVGAEYVLGGSPEGPTSGRNSSPRTSSEWPSTQPASRSWRSGAWSTTRCATSGRSPATPASTTWRLPFGPVTPIHDVARARGMPG